jgi:hypothetical protein
VPPQDRGLLARLDALVELAADRHGLALAAGGRLAAAEAWAAARAAGLTSTARGPTPRGPAAHGSAQPVGAVRRDHQLPAGSSAAPPHAAHLRH